MEQKDFLSGFISIIGCPNVGKSTLLNALVGQKISIVSPRAQTTRNRITGVRTENDYQMIFLDTPGVVSPRSKLGVYMDQVVNSSLNMVEAILFLLDPIEGMKEKDNGVIERIKGAKAPLIGVVNKTDLCSLMQKENAMDYLSNAGCFDEIISVSAKTGENITKLLQMLKGYLIAGPMYYPREMVTDQPERFICAELIREKALYYLKHEIPHGIGVEIESYNTRDDRDITDICALIYCEREGHKGIIIGKKGSMLKKIGEDSRKDMEWMLMSQVNLKLFVKVRENWRDNTRALRELGYE